MNGYESIVIRDAGTTDDLEVWADLSSSESPLPRGGLTNVLGVPRSLPSAQAGWVRRGLKKGAGIKLIWAMGLVNEPKVRIEKIGEYDGPETAGRHLLLDLDAVSVVPTKKRELEILWLADHKQELRQYEGQWIGLEGYNLIAHDRQLSNVTRTLKEQGVEVPFTMFVPRSTEGIFMGL